MVFFTSDLHFGHDREFIYKSRGFDSVEEMNESLIFNWNELIDPEDEIYVLGDLMMNDISKGAECWKRLKGKKYVILGNHDSNVRIRLYRELPNTEISGYALPYKYMNYNFFLSHYPTITFNYDTDEPLSVQVIDLCGHPAACNQSFGRPHPFPVADVHRQHQVKRAFILFRNTEQISSWKKAQ